MTHFSHIFPLWMESTTVAWRQEYLVMPVLGCTEQLGRPVLDGLRQAAGRRRSLGSSSTHCVSFHHSACFFKLLPVNPVFPGDSGVRESNVSGVEN